MEWLKKYSLGYLNGNFHIILQRENMIQKP